MKKVILISCAFLISGTANAAVQVQKTTFEREYYNQLRHPKSLARFNEGYRVPVTAQQPQQTWVPTSRVIPQAVQPVAQPMISQQDVRRPANQFAQQPVQPQPYVQPPQPQLAYFSEPAVAPTPLAGPTPKYNGEDYIVNNSNGFFAITPKIGTQGVGLDGVIKVNDHLRFRGGGNWLEYSGSHQVDSIDYDYDASILNGNTFIDYHPFATGFRITGGAFYQPDEIEFKATPASAVTIGNASYTPTEIGTMTTKIETGDISPYAGIGYSDAFSYNGRDKHWFLETDLGVKFNDVSSTTTSTGSLANDPTFRADLQREKNNIQDEFDILEYYPILNIGVTYKF